MFAGFATAMGTGLMMVFGVLMLLFGSVFQPITILCRCRCPSAAWCWRCWLTNNADQSCRWCIGILMLMGIVTKNAIMLVDFAVEEVKQGMYRARGDHRRRAQAGAADRHDDHRHGRPA